MSDVALRELYEDAKEELARLRNRLREVTSELLLLKATPAPAQPPLCKCGHSKGMHSFRCRPANGWNGEYKDCYAERCNCREFRAAAELPRPEPPTSLKEDVNDDTK